MTDTNSFGGGRIVLIGDCLRIESNTLATNKPGKLLANGYPYFSQDITPAAIRNGGSGGYIYVSMKHVYN